MADDVMDKAAADAKPVPGNGIGATVAPRESRAERARRVAYRNRFAAFYVAARDRRGRRRRCAAGPRRPREPCPRSRLVGVGADRKLRAPRRADRRPRRRPVPPPERQGARRRHVRRAADGDRPRRLHLPGAGHRGSAGHDGRARGGRRHRHRQRGEHRHVHALRARHRVLDRRRQADRRPWAAAPPRGARARALLVPLPRRHRLHARAAAAPRRREGCDGRIRRAQRRSPRARPPARTRRSPRRSRPASARSSRTSSAWSTGRPARGCTSTATSRRRTEAPSWCSLPRFWLSARSSAARSSRESLKASASRPLPSRSDCGCASAREGPPRHARLLPGACPHRARAHLRRAMVLPDPGLPPLPRLRVLADDPA